MMFITTSTDLFLFDVLRAHKTAQGHSAGFQLHVARCREMDLGQCAKTLHIPYQMSELFFGMFMRCIECMIPDRVSSTE